MGIRRQRKWGPGRNKDLGDHAFSCAVYPYFIVTKDNAPRKPGEALPETKQTTGCHRIQGEHCSRKCHCQGCLMLRASPQHMIRCYSYLRPKVARRWLRYVQRNIQTRSRHHKEQVSHQMVKEWAYLCGNGILGRGAGEFLLAEDIMCSRPSIYIRGCL